MQHDFPLSSRLLGLWLWNDYAARFLSAHPPRSFDIHGVSEGFERFLERAAGSRPISRGPHVAALPVHALQQAVQIDVAYRRVFVAPTPPPFVLTPEAVEGLATKRLRLSPACELVHEDWPLLELRDSSRGRQDETPLVLPAPLPSPRVWALVRTPSGLARVPLEAVHARLLHALRELTVGEVLALIESECPPAERATLPERTQGWLAQSVNLGIFCGVDPA
jgi:hypothetical protein